MPTGDLFKRLSPGAIYTPEEEAVRSWVKLNATTFREQAWTALEAAHLAIELGFDVMAVRSVMGHWKDALAGTHFENRAAMNDYRLECAMEDFSRLRDELTNDPALDLAPRWKEVNAYQYEGVEFDAMV